MDIYIAYILNISPAVATHKKRKEKVSQNPKVARIANQSCLFS